MPYLVELPDGRSVEFPDEVTPDQAGQILRKQFSTGDFGSVPTPVPPPTTIGGELLEVLKGLPRGAAGLLETATAGAAALLPDEAERELRGEIEEFFKPIQQGLAAAPGYEESIGAKAGEALGSTLPFLAAGPFGVAGRVAATGLGVAAGAGEARLRAEQEGGMEERGAATALGALVGTTEVLPIFRILNRLPEKEVLGVLDYVKRAAMAGGEEFAQEASANVAQNLIEKGLYNPEQDVFEGSVEEGAYGFGVGAFIQGLVDLAVGRRARGVAPPPGEENEPTGIGAGQTVAGAGAGGDGLPVSLDGTEGPDLESAPTGGVGVPRTAPERADERAEAGTNTVVPSASLDLKQLTNAWDFRNRSSRSDSWFEGAKVDDDARAGFDAALQNGGTQLPAHGMAKERTLSGGVDSLLNMLQNGLDPNRRGGRLDYAPLVTQVGSAESLISTTPGGSAYSDGPFILVARPGQEFEGKLDGLGAILVNQAHAEIVPALRQAVQAIRPDVLVEPYSNAGEVAKQLTTPSTEPARFQMGEPKKKEVDYSPQRFAEVETSVNGKKVKRLIEITRETPDGTVVGRRVNKDGSVWEDPKAEEKGISREEVVVTNKRSIKKDLRLNLIYGELQQLATPSTEPARFQMGEPGKWYYSELKRQVERAKVEKTKPDQWLNVLSRAQGVKKEEIEETGLEEWLKLQGNRSVSKQEISNYLENNGVQVNEVFQDSKPKFILLRNGDVVGTFDTAGAAQQAIFENSVTRATELANEGLIDPDSVDAFAESEAGEYELQQRESGTGYASYAIPQESAFTEDGQKGVFGTNYRELLLTLPSTGKDEYRSHNWPGISNILAHIRMDDRPVMDLSGLREAEKLREQADVLRRDSVAFFGDPDKFSELNVKVRELMTQAGRLENENRVIPSLKNNLFVHEIQSDWGQDARDYGVRTPEVIELLNKIEDTENLINDFQETEAYLADRNFYFRKTEQNKEFVLETPLPDMSTAQVKRDELPPRSSLREKFDFLSANYKKYLEARKNIGRYKLDILEIAGGKSGKYESAVPSAPFIKQTNTWVDLALKRVMTYAVENGYDSISFANSKEVFNTIGGKLEGHKKFYDEILPQQLNKLARKLGAKVERHGDRTVLVLTPEATKNIAGKLPLFRKQGRPVKTPLSVSAVQQAVKDLTQGWQNKPNIVVVGTHKDLPPAYRSDKYKSVRGMLLGNDMYIVAANAGSVSDVRSTVFHESLGHYGLRELFRTRLDDVLNDIYKTNKAVKAAADAYLKRYPDVYTGGDRYARAVEEVLAEKSENGVIKEPGIRAAFNRLAAMIRKFLRGMGLVRNYTNNDINNIMLEAAERVRSQPPNPFDTAASPRFQMSQYNRVLSNAIQQNQRLPGWSQGVGDGVANAMSTMPEGLRRAQYYMYSMPQVIELLERYTPRIRAIDRFIGYRASYTTGIMKVGSDNHAKYTRAVRENPDLYEEFKNVTNDINLFQVRVRDQDVIDLLRQPRASLTPQKQKYYDVARRFYALPESLQNSIQTRDGSGGLFADYRKLGDEKFDIFAKVYGGQLGSGVVRQLREQFQRDRLPMYAPLVRGEGQHWLYYETTDGRSYKTSFKSQAAREAAIREALDQGLAVPNSIVRATRAAELRDRGPPPTGFLGDVIERLEATLPNTMPAADRRQVIDGVYETFLQYMPSNMLRQELSSRETFEVDGVKQFGVLGFDEDVLDVYERTIPKMAYQLGNLKFALPIENAMKKVAEQAKLYEIAYREDNLPQRLKGRRLMAPKAVFDGVEDMRRRINFAYNPTYAPWVNGLATGNYIYSIAGNVSSALINTTVLPMMTFPSLVAQYGVMKSSAAMARASKMFAQGGVDDQGNFTFGNAATEEAKTFFNYLEKRGVIGIAAEQELQQAQRAKISGYESMLDKLNFVLGYVFKNSERFNREVTLLASFMLAREKGKSFKTAAEEAIRLNNNINGTVLPESASRLYQTNLGRVILTFRTFALTQIINLSRAFGRALNVVDATPEERSIARKQLLGIYGMTYMMAGLKGLPLFSAAEVLAAALMGDDDEPYDLQQEVLDSVGLMGLNGPLNAMFGVDIASRTGFNGMLWRDDPKRLADIGFLLYTFERIGGPSYGLIQAQIRGMEKIADGDLQRGLESMLPAPLRNPLKAARYATEGALTKDGLPIVDDVSTWNTTMQIFGFAPAELAATQEQISTKFAISDKLRNRRTAILEQIYTAMVAGDSEALQKALESVNKFNQANPMFGIDYKSIEASFRERQRRALESINGIYLPQDLLYTTEEYMADLN